MFCVGRFGYYYVRGCNIKTLLAATTDMSDEILCGTKNVKTSLDDIVQFL